MATFDGYPYSGDGWVGNRNVNYQTAHDAASGDGAKPSDWEIIPRNGKSGSYYYIARGYLSFNTSEIEDYAIIQGGYLRFYIDAASAPADEWLCLTKANQASLTTLTTSDFSKIEDDILGEIENPSTGWNNITLNTLGTYAINKTEATKFALRIKRDINSSSYESEDKYEIRSMDYPVGGYEPLLHLEYEPGPSSIINETLGIQSYLKLNDTYIEGTTVNLTSSIDTSLLPKIQETLNLTSSILSSTNRLISETLNFSTSIQTQFKYYITHQLNLTSQLEVYKEADYAITDEILPTPPRFKLLGYKVIQEYGSPYFTAELNFQGTEIPDVDEYITLYQTDAENGSHVIIFRGFPIEVDWDLKKDLTTASVKAVTNGWYLTKQNVPKDECTPPEYWAIDWLRNGRSFKYCYAQMNEMMALWDYLNFVPSERDFEDYWDELNITVERRATGFSTYAPGAWDSTKGIYLRWEDIAGIAPSYRLLEEVQGYCNNYNYSWMPDIKGNFTDPWQWNGGFNDFETTKYDAIMQFSDYGDRVFHMRIAQSDTDIPKKQDGGYYDKGTLVAFWTNASSANATTNGGIEPFNALLDIDATVDNTFIRATKQQRNTERSLPNLVQIRSQEQAWLGTFDFYNDGYYPCEWWQRASGKIECGSYWWEHQKPVIHYKTTSELNESEVFVFAQDFYNRVREGEDKYSANFLSSVVERNGTKIILPGSNIRITNVSNHSDEVMKIMKIVHSKDGAKPAMTDIEYCKVYDMAHPNVIESGLVERILADFERKAIRGTRLKTWPNPSNPRKIGIGYPVYAELGMVESINTSETLADVILLNTSRIIKNVIVM